MTTAWDKIAKKGRQKSKRFLSEQVDGLRRNLTDIVLGQSETRVAHIQTDCTSDDATTSFRGREARDSLETTHSKRFYNSLRQCDSKGTHLSKEQQVEKQIENRLRDSAGKDQLTKVSSTDRKGRVKRRPRNAHSEEGVGQRGEFLKELNINRDNNRSSYPPLVAANNSNEAPIQCPDTKVQTAVSYEVQKDQELQRQRLLSRDCSIRMEYSTRLKTSVKPSTKREVSSSSNGERKESFERIRSYSTGGRMTGKQSTKKQTDVIIRKPPKAPSWQSLLSPSPSSTHSSSEKKKHLNKTESIPKSIGLTQLKPDDTVTPRPPKPPSWQTLTIPSQTDGTNWRSNSPLNSNHLSKQSQSTQCGGENERQPSEPTREEDSVSDISAQSGSPDQRRQRKINIKRTRSRFIDSKEVPKQQTVVRLSQAKPLEYNLRETEFDNMIYLRENAERCKRWLQSLEYQDHRKNSEYLDDRGQFMNYEESFRDKYNFIGSPYPSSVSSHGTL